MAKLLIGGVIVLVLVHASILLVLTWPITDWSIEKAGVFGDSFGILTSLFSGLAFSGMIITILLQKDELALQRNEIRGQKEVLKAQNFNASFFRLLDFYKKNLSELSVLNDDNGRLFGIDAISFLLKKLKAQYASYGFPHYSKKDHDMQLEMEYALFVCVQQILFRQKRYVDTIYCIYQLIDLNIEDIDEKKVYWGLLASQFTVCELNYLFYQCLVAPEDDGLRNYIHESELFISHPPNVSATHRMIYEKHHSVTLPKHSGLFYVPFDRRSMREVKRRHKQRMNQ